MTIRTKKHLSIITTVSLTLFSLAYTTLSYLPNNIQSTQAYSYSSGYIDVVHENRQTPEEPSGSMDDVPISGLANSFVSPNCGGGYNNQSDNFVKKLNSSTNSYYFDLNLPTGTYEVDITARYGKMDEQCTTYQNESNETLNITIDGQTESVSDQGNTFAWYNFSHVASGFEVTNPDEGPVRIEVKGTGSGTVEFGAIRVYGETHETTNVIPELTDWSYTDCEQFSFRVYDEDVDNMTGTRPDYHINLYADNDGYPAGTGAANQIGSTITGQYNTDGYSDTITINIADYPDIFDEYRAYTIIVWAVDYDSDGNRIDDDLNGWVLIGEEVIDLTNCAPVYNLTIDKKVNGQDAVTVSNGATLNYSVTLNADSGNTGALEVDLSDTAHSLPHVDYDQTTTRLRINSVEQASGFSLLNIPDFTMEPGDTAILNYSAIANYDDPCGTSVTDTNTATATTTPPIGTLTDDASVTINAPACNYDLSIVKTVNTQQAVTVSDGDPLQYEVTVTAPTGNTGTLTGIVLTDNVDSLAHNGPITNTTISIAGGAPISQNINSITPFDLGPGQSAVLTYETIADYDSTCGTSVTDTNTATASHTLLNGDRTDTAAVTINAPACAYALNVIKTVDGHDANTSAYRVNNGDTLTYAVTLTTPGTNSGNLNVSLTDTINSLPYLTNITNTQLVTPNGTQTGFPITSIPNVQLGPAETAVLSYNADANYPTAGATSPEQRNVATATATHIGSITDPARIIIDGPPAVNTSRVCITKTSSPASPFPANAEGDPTGTADYTIELTNTILSGTGQTASGLQFTDVFNSATNGGSPTGYSNIQNASKNGNIFTVTPDIAPNTTVTVNYTVDFTTTGIPSVPIGNTAQVSDITNHVQITDTGGTQAGSYNCRNDEATMRLVGGFDPAQYTFTIEKDVNGNPADTPAAAEEVANGDTLAYRIIFSANASNTDTVEADISDNVESLPYITNIENIRFRIVPDAFQSVPSLNIDPFDLEPGQTAVLRYEATAESTATTPQLQMNTATATVNVPTTSTLTDPAYVRIAPGEYALDVEKTVNGEDADTALDAVEVENLDDLSYEISVDAPASNPGSTHVTLTDSIDSLTYITSIRNIILTTPAFVSSVADINAIPEFDLDSGEQATLTYTATASYTGTIQSLPQQNTATVSSPDSTGDTDNANVIINPTSHENVLEIEKYVNGHDADTIGSAYYADNEQTLGYRITVNAPSSNTDDLLVTLTDTVDALPYITNIRDIKLTIGNHPAVSVANINAIPTFTLAAGQGAELRYKATASYTGNVASDPQVNTASANSPMTIAVTDVATVIINNVENNLTIEKTVNGEDADTSGTAVEVDHGDTLDYVVRVETPSTNGSNVVVNLDDNANTLTYVADIETITLSVNGGSIISVPNLNMIPVFTLGPDEYAVLQYSATAENTTDNPQEEVNTATAQSTTIPAVYDQAFVRIVPAPASTAHLTIIDKVGTIFGTYHDADTTGTAVDFGAVTGSVTAYYQVTVTNSGNTEATNVDFNTVFTNGSNGTTRTNITTVTGATYNSATDQFTIATIPAGGDAVVRFSATLNPPAQADPALTDNAFDTDTIVAFDTTAQTSSGIGQNDPAYISITGPTTPGEAQFTIDKSVSDDTLEDNDTTTYTIRVSNTGTTEGSVTVTDTIGDSGRGYISCDDGGQLDYNNDMDVTGAVSHTGSIDTSAGVTLTIAAGGTATITYTVDADTDGMDDKEESTCDNVALLSTGEQDAERVTIKEEAEFSVNKRVSPGEAEDGDIVTYRITIENESDITSDVELTDTIGRGSRGYLSGDHNVRLVYVPNSIRITGISSSDVRGDIDDSRGMKFKDVEGDDNIEIEYEVRVEASDLPSGTTTIVNNVAEIEWDGGDDDDRASVRITGGAVPDEDFTIRKSANPVEVRDGGVVTYQIVVQNIGESASTAVVKDSIARSGFLTGDNGGTIRYMEGSMRISGHGQYSGQIDNLAGVTLYDIPPSRSVFITYQGIASTEGMGNSSMSNVTNVVILNDTTEASTVVQISENPLPTPPVPPPTPIVIVSPPPITASSGSGSPIPTASAIAILGAAITSVYLRRKDLFLYFSNLIG